MRETEGKQRALSTSANEQGQSGHRLEASAEYHRALEDWVIQTKRLERAYKLGPTEVRALRGVDLCIARGEFVALMGPSGSGKSTLMHLLGCLDTPTGGQYWLEGKEVSTLSANEQSWVRSTRIGFVFQTYNLLPRLTALENVALPLLYQKQSGNAIGRATEALERVGLGERLAHRPVEMSGGECQRVAVARALVTRPAIILADEPTGNLDSRSGSGILHLLGDLNAEGRTLLLVTHDRQVAAHAQRVIHMHDGRIVGHAAMSSRMLDGVPQAIALTAKRSQASDGGTAARPHAYGVTMV